MKPSPTRLRNPRKNPNPVSKAALLAAAALGMWPHAHAQTPAQDALKRPIAESGLLQQIDQINAADTRKNTAATATKPVPRALPVDPRKAVPTPDPTEPAAAPSKKDKGPTEITSDNVTFDNRTHVAIFTGNVIVTDPEFHLTCNKLTAYLKHDEPNAAAAPKPAAKADADDKNPPPKKGGLERAVAEGNVFIVQEKQDADGNPSRSTGKSKFADYDARTGDVVLKGSPTVHQGMNECIATSEGTVMTLNRDRNMKVDGPSRTVITEKSDLEKKQ